MPSSVDTANEVHAELLRAIAPVTPGTIRASSLSWRRNPQLFGIACSAGISFLIFIVPIIMWADDASNHKAFTELCQIIGAAGMGSAFYALYTASGYINSTTFDQRYSSTYVVRFCLGVLAGIILGYFLKELLHLGSSGTGATAPGGPLPGGTPPSGTPPTAAGVTAPSGAASGGKGTGGPAADIAVSALALIGGFASDAVARILFRVSETLVALVSGTDKEKVDAARQKAVAEAEKKSAQALVDVEKKNAQAASDIVKDLQAATADPAQMTAKVNEAIAKIVGRR